VLRRRRAIRSQTLDQPILKTPEEFLQAAIFRNLFQGHLELLARWAIRDQTMDPARLDATRAFRILETHRTVQILPTWTRFSDFISGQVDSVFSGWSLSVRV
jgi:hypothetical protein